MTELEALIQFWATTLRNKAWLLDPSTKRLIEWTIKHLKELQALKGEP